MARLVVFFVVHPRQRFHMRELLRRTRLSSASLQAELRRLVELGAVRREEDGGRVRLSMAEGHPAWFPWMLLLKSCAAPADVLREALVDAHGLESAFIFGSVARGDADERSDLDVFLVGEKDACVRAEYLLNDAAILIERPLDVIAYTSDDLRRRLRAGSGFLEQVVREPRLWLVGEPSRPDEAAAA